MRAVSKIPKTKLVAVERLQDRKEVDICTCVLSFGDMEKVLSVLFRIEEHEILTLKRRKVRVLCASVLDATRKHRLKSSCNLNGEVTDSQYQSCMSDIGRRIFLDDLYRGLDWSKSELIGLNG